MSQHTSRSKEPLTTLAGAPPLTYRPIAPAPNPVICVDPGANRAWSVPIGESSLTNRLSTKLLVLPRLVTVGSDVTLPLG